MHDFHWGNSAVFQLLTWLPSNRWHDSSDCNLLLLPRSRMALKWPSCEGESWHGGKKQQSLFESTNTCAEVALQLTKLWLKMQSSQLSCKKLATNALAKLLLRVIIRLSSLIYGFFQTNPIHISRSRSQKIAKITMAILSLGNQVEAFFANGCCQNC